MLTKAQINAASSTIDETDLAMMIATIRGSSKYQANPAYFAEFSGKIEDADGSIQAKQLNAALTAISDLGIGVVEIDQRRVGGSDGLWYSQVNTRNSLIDYMIAILYPEYFETVLAVTDEYGNILNGYSYQVGQREVIWP